MLGCNESVTLWKRNFNAETKKDEYALSILPVLCKWKSRAIRTATENGAIIKQYVTVIIPCGSFFAFDGKVGDIMARGVHTVKITGEKPYTASEVKQLLSPDIIEIKAVYDNSRVERGRHVKVEGV